MSNRIFCRGLRYFIHFLDDIEFGEDEDEDEDDDTIEYD